jgi:hypothetical protein
MTGSGVTRQPTQTERLVAFVRANPGCTGLEIIQALALPKYTSRISDARALGVVIECVKRKDGRNGYVVKERRPVDRGEMVGMGL